MCLPSGDDNRLPFYTNNPFNFWGVTIFQWPILPPSLPVLTEVLLNLSLVLSSLVVHLRTSLQFVTRRACAEIGRTCDSPRMGLPWTHFLLFSHLGYPSQDVRAQQCLFHLCTRYSTGYVTGLTRRNREITVGFSTTISSWWRVYIQVRELSFSTRKTNVHVSQ